MLAKSIILNVSKTFKKNVQSLLLGTKFKLVKYDIQLPDIFIFILSVS